MVCGGDHLRGIFGVRAGRKSKENPNAQRVQPDQLIHNLVFRTDRIDPAEFRGERLDSQFVDASLVHAGSIEVADLLLHRRAFEIVDGGLFQNSAQDGAIAIRQLIENTPAGLVGGNGIVGHPGSAGVLIKVDAGIDRRVHIGGAES